MLNASLYLPCPPAKCVSATRCFVQEKSPLMPTGKSEEEAKNANIRAESNQRSIFIRCHIVIKGVRTSEQNGCGDDVREVHECMIV